MQKLRNFLCAIKVLRSCGKTSRGEHVVSGVNFKNPLTYIIIGLLLIPIFIDGGIHNVKEFIKGIIN